MRKELQVMKKLDQLPPSQGFFFQRWLREYLMIMDMFEGIKAHFACCYEWCLWNTRVTKSWGSCSQLVGKDISHTLCQWEMIYQISPADNWKPVKGFSRVLLCILSKALFARQESTVIDLAVLLHYGCQDLSITTTYHEECCVACIGNVSELFLSL